MMKLKKLIKILRDAEQRLIDAQYAESAAEEAHEKATHEYREADIAQKSALRELRSAIAAETVKPEGW